MHVKADATLPGTRRSKKGVKLIVDVALGPHLRFGPDDYGDLSLAHVVFVLLMAACMAEGSARI